MTDVCVPAMGDEAFVAWLDRVIDRHEKDVAEAIERTGRLTRALVKLREARAVLTAAPGVPPPEPPKAPSSSLHSCPHCPRTFSSGASLGGHIGKAHPGAKAKVAAELTAALAKAASAPAANGTAASLPASKVEAPARDEPAPAVLPPAMEAEVAADDPAPSPPPAQPGEMVCPLRSDRGGACWFAAGDAEQMDRHLRRRHSLYGGDDPDDVEYRAEAVRAAQAAAGLPAEWGL